MAIESVLVAEPTASVTLHLFGERPRAGLDRLRVELAAFDPISGFRDLGVDGDALRALYERIPAGAASARSNLVRYAVLARHGGIYMDCDALVIRSLADLRRGSAFVGEERVLAIDDAWQAGIRAPAMLPAGAAWLAGRSLTRVASAVRSPRLARLAARLEPYWQATAINNAVIGAAPRAPFLSRVLRTALAADPAIRYALGPSLLTRVVRAGTADVRVLPPAAFYAVPPSYSFQFFTGGVGASAPALSPEARVLHVVSSNHRRLLAALDADTVRARRDRGVYYRAAAAVAAGRS